MMHSHKLEAYMAQSVKKRAKKSLAKGGKKGTHSQPSAKISSHKAKKILEDGEVRGHKLTPRQRGMFGAAAGRGR